MKKKLAVVVPMYNVQDFLNESLNSLLKQGLNKEDLQVILIDDGSSDNTFEIANNYVNKYPDIFEVHRFENGGLGAARNRGSYFADSEYITYVDPDDMVVSNSYSKALSILDKSDSDILVGGTKRFNSTKYWDSFIHSKSVSKNKIGTTLKESPELIWDSTSWNKIYKLSYLRNNSFYFPENMLYEDLPFVTPALAKAKSIDVMANTLYLWRVRDYGAPSITQLSSNDPQPILDRLKANELVLKSLEKMGVSDNIIEDQAQKFLDFDTLMMFRKSRYNLFSDNQKNILFNALKNYLKQFSSEQISNSMFENQVYFQRVLQIQNISEFNKLTISFLRNETNYYGEWHNGVWTLLSNISNLRKVATCKDFNMQTKIQEVSFDEENLNITGYIYAKYSDMSKIECVKNARIILYDANHDILNDDIGHINIFENKKVTSKFGYNKNHFVKNGSDFNYDYSGYRISIPLNDLLIDSDYFTMAISLKIDGILLSIDIKNPIPGNIVRPEVNVSDTLKAAFEIEYDSSNWVLHLKAHANVPILKYKADNIFQIDNSYDEIFLQKDSIKLPLKKVGNKLILPQKVFDRLSHYEKEARGAWHFYTTNGKFNSPVYLLTDNPIRLRHHALFKILYSKGGQAILEISWYYPKTKQVTVKNNVLNIDFELFGWELEALTVQIVADYSLPEITWPTTKIGVSTYRLTIPMTLDGFGKKEWLNFMVKMTFIDGYETSQILKWGDEKNPLENSLISANNVCWEFKRVLRNNGGFAIKRTADRIYRKEIGSFEKFLENEYSEWLKEPLLKNTIVWSAYWGRNNNFNGNPRALYDYVSKEYPNFKNIIVIKDAIAVFNEYGPNTKIISFGTKEYWYYLAKAKYFVNDVNFTQAERSKREDQVEIQTMHGTPLKTMGFDVLDEWNDVTYNKIHKRYEAYDYLVVPSDWVGEYAKHAFNIHPTLLKTGYPRNDVFFRKNSVTEIKSIKQRLGLPLDKKIILYTPTFRIKNEKVSLEQRFNDLDGLYKSLGSDKIMVIKNHNFDTYEPVPDKYSDKVFLVNPYEEISDLYIISDALITDYSSVMFDYMLLHKPMMFWAYDYDQYINNRGINFDLKNEAPGPFIQKQKELEKWINKFDTIPFRFEKNINDFLYKFGQYDDGFASKKIAEIVFGER